jgi:hypothetical protein
MEQKNCRNCEAKFKITDGDLVFYKKMNVPAPKTCPRCRLVRRLNERNAKTLYSRKCDATGKMIISQFRPDAPFPVYEQNFWWGDDWDPLDYGQDFDFSRPFFEQFTELRNKVPQMSLFVINETLENSEYTNCTGYLKNCYLIGEADYDEDCYFSNRIFHSKNIMDCSTVSDCELCYDCIDCAKCQRLFYSQECRSCHDSYFLQDCVSCQDCIGCINQRQKKFMIFDRQYRQKEYERLKADMHLETREGVENLRTKCEDFFKSHPQVNVHEEQTQNCSGDHLYNSKNSDVCFDCSGLEDCKYCSRLIGPVKSCMDYSSWGDRAELIYQCVSCGDGVYNLKFCSNCTTNNSNLEYCYQCTGCDECFGCTSLKRKKFCILNKQYSEAEYRKLKARIVSHMRETGEYGDFFPKDFCPHGYNTTLAMDEFPLSREEALAQGWRWSEPIEINSRGEIICECGKSFNFIPQELAFYERLRVPAPETCQLCRHKARQEKRSRIKLWDKACDKCGENMKTSIPPDDERLIYCKACYLKEVY